MMPIRLICYKKTNQVQFIFKRPAIIEVSSSLETSVNLRSKLLVFYYFTLASTSSTISCDYVNQRTMALSSSFKDRIEQMETTRNQRLSLLQTEKEVQNKKSETLASKLSEIRYIEQKCLKLEQKIASQQFMISSIKSQLDRIDSIYPTQIHQFRVLKSEVEDLEELDKEKDKYYALKTRAIDEFRAQAEKFATECEKRVGALRNCLNGLNSSFVQLQKNAGCSDNDELNAAEMRKFELQAVKDNLDRKLASNYETKAQLQKQLRRMLISQNKREPHHVG